MSGFRTPEIAREQIVLWEHRLEDALPNDHQARHLDFLLGSAAFADTFAEMQRSYVLNRGKPPYQPRDMAALYLFGMLHRLRSSRQLEEACHARLDVIWLMRGQTPDHSTIADFVGKHKKTLRKLFRDTLRVLLAAEMVHLSHTAFDGSKLEADAGRNSVRSQEKIASWDKHLSEQAAVLEQEWAENEKREADLFGQSSPWTDVREKDAEKALAKLKRKREKLQEALDQIERRQAAHVGSKPLKRIASTSDPDARSMKDKEGRGKPNFNVQIAVDDAYGVIVAADVNDATDDSGQLAAMEEREIDCHLPDAGANSAAAPPDEATQAALARVAKGQPLSESQWAALPRNNKKMIDRAAFVYDERKDEYRCPAGHALVFLRTSKDKKKWGTSERRQ